MTLSKEMKKVLLTGIVVVVAALLVYGGVSAYFSSTVVIAPNLFTAGTIEMKVNEQNPYSGTFTAGLTHLKPCMKGWGNVTLNNTGTNPFDVWLKVDNVSTWPGTETVPESQEPAATDIDSVMQYDLMVGGTMKIPDSSGYTISTGAHGSPSTAMKNSWIYLGNMSPAQKLNVNESFMLNCTTTNWAQGDEMLFNVTFYAQQNESTQGPVPAPTPELSPFGRP